MLELSGSFRGVVTSDEHSPFHNPKALALANKVAAWWRPNLWLLNGDQLDCHDLSTFPKDPGSLSFQEEIDVWHTQILGPQMAAAPDAKFVKIDGNHEERLPKYISKAEGIKDLRAIRIEAVLELDRLGIVHAPKGVLLNDSLLVTHGESANKWAGSSVRSELEETRYLYNVIIGHAHRQGRVPVRVGDSWVIGQENPCLCSLFPGYTLNPDWSLGLSLFISEPGRCHIIPVNFAGDYSCYVGDQLFQL